MPETMDQLNEAVRISTLGDTHRPSLMVSFALGKDNKEWPNQIIYNDPGHTVFALHTKKDAEGNISNIELNGNIYGYSDRKTFKSDKAGWRNIKTPTDINGVVKNLTKYFDNMKALHEEYLKTLVPATPAPEPATEKMYIWENCVTPGTCVVGIGAYEQEAFSKLNPQNRNLATMSDLCREYPNIIEGFRHNMSYNKSQSVEKNIPATPQATEAGFNAMFDALSKRLPDNFVKTEAPKPDVVPTHLAYVKISDNHIVGYLSKNNNICTGVADAQDVTNHTATVHNAAKDLLKHPNILDHHGALKTKLVQYHKDGQYISGVSVPQNDKELVPSIIPNVATFNIGDKVIITPENLKSLSTYDGDSEDNRAITTRLSNNKIQGTITGYNPQLDTAGVKFNNEISYNDGVELLIVHPSKNLTKTTQVQTNNTSLPYLSAAEQQELINFVSAIKHNYPDAKTESLHKLCNIASDMQKYTIQNNNGTLSAEKFNSLTDHQEKQIQELIKDLPGVKISLPYEPMSVAIKIGIPAQNLLSGCYTCNVPEIPKNKLTIAPVPTKTATEIVSKKR